MKLFIRVFLILGGLLPFFTFLCILLVASFSFDIMLNLGPDHALQLFLLPFILGGISAIIAYSNVQKVQFENERVREIWTRLIIAGWGIGIALYGWKGREFRQSKNVNFFPHKTFLPPPWICPFLDILAIGTYLFLSLGIILFVSPFLYLLFGYSVNNATFSMTFVGIRFLCGGEFCYFLFNAALMVHRATHLLECFIEQKKFEWEYPKFFGFRTNAFKYYWSIVRKEMRGVG